MSLSALVLFERPQQEIASLLADRISRSSTTSIVTGFLTPDGAEAISGPIQARPQCLKTFIVGAATYPGFAALDELIDAGVPSDRLHIHLGHTQQTGGRRNPFARYHPMLHSKIYYMEFPDSTAAAFVGSHNVTSFALTGLNGEAAIMLEGPVESPEFAKIRKHIDTAQNQAVRYSPNLKEAYAWWTREFIDGLHAEMRLPQDWQVARTILVFATAATSDRPKTGNYLYFEIPDGIEQIESLRTETHLFLFNTLPSDPWQAIYARSSADARYTCKTLGVENRQGNRELVADWHLDGARPVLRSTSSRTYRPSTPSGMQQVRAEVEKVGVFPFEYGFERERTGWEPEVSSADEVYPFEDMTADSRKALESPGGARKRGWGLVKGLVPRRGTALERDEAALKRAAPDSGAFILVSLRRRRKDRVRRQELEF
jgi:hypothetical protein